jgi:hypothetical protein
METSCERQQYTFREPGIELLDPAARGKIERENAAID